MFPALAGRLLTTGSPGKSFVAFKFSFSIFWVLVSFLTIGCIVHTDAFITFLLFYQFSSVYSLSRVRVFATPWTAAQQASLSITSSQSLLKLMSMSWMSWWCHPTISSSVIPFSPSPQSFPASGSFQMSQLFASGGQNIGVSASSSVLPMNIQDWFPLGWSVWISLQSKGLSRVIMSKIIKEKCISSLHQFGGNGHLNSNEPSNPWAWYISFLTYIFFNFTQQCFSIFSILHFFKK